MAFFEELGRKAKDVAAVAADKAKDVAAVAADKARETTELTKLAVAIAGEQRELEKNYRLIGEWFMNEYDGELPEGVSELAAAVAASKAKIAELEEQKTAVKSESAVEAEGAVVEPAAKVCPVCGAESDSKFCPKCGARWTEQIHENCRGAKVPRQFFYNPRQLSGRRQERSLFCRRIEDSSASRSAFSVPRRSR